MDKLKIFENPEFGKIRTVALDGEPWLVGKDVALALKYKNPQEAIRTHVDDEDKGVSEILTPGGKQTVPIINESGVYALILSSKLPTAKKFKRWVTSEVLPSIRKTGGYMTPEAQAQLADIVRAQVDIVKGQTALFKSLAEQARAQTGMMETIKALAEKVAALDGNKPAVVCVKEPPDVSLTGFAKAAAAARKAVLDMGGSRWEAGVEVVRLMNQCGLPIPPWAERECKETLSLKDFLEYW